MVRRTSQHFEHSPTAWFCVLEGAIRKEDYPLAKKATRQLRRLGVDVRFRNSRQLNEVLA